MSFERMLAAAVIVGAGTASHAAMIVSSVSYSAYSNLIDTNNTVLDSQGASGSMLSGGSVSADNSGTRSDYNVTTQHSGESDFSLAVTPFGLTGGGMSRSRTTYLEGGNSFIGQATVSGFGSTVRFTVDSSQEFVATLDGTVNTFHRAYQPDGPAGAFFNYLRLFAPGGYLFNSQSLNSSTLGNVPFSQTITLHPGTNYELEFAAASSGVTINFAVPQAGPGAFGETAFSLGYSITTVPEPRAISPLGVAMVGLRRGRRVAVRG